MLKQVKGNLITLAQQGQFDLIAHGCNCFLCFGAGIAASIKIAFPEAYHADLRTARGDMKKLGTISYHVYEDLTVVNAYTQYRYGRGGPHLDYDAVASCMKEIKEFLNMHPKHFNRRRIGLPLIGAGLAGGSWPRIQRIIEEQLKGEDVTIVTLD